MSTSKKSRAAKAHSSPAHNGNPDHPGVSDEQLARIGAFYKSPAGTALQETETELEAGIAVASMVLQVLEATSGDEREATALRIAIDHLERAADHLDIGCGNAARASGVVAEGALQ